VADRVGVAQGLESEEPSSPDMAGLVRSYGGLDGV
jgi:transcriptional regulator